MSNEPWWRTAVVYQIYPRSFADASGDGIGDLAGIIGRLDHLSWLGVDALWLSPIQPSPMADFGYDVSDYCDVDPIFGSLADFDRLLEEAHGRGIKVVLDWVPNHTSDRHPWFLDSRSSRDSPKRDWYVWRDGGADGGPPNNWRAAFTGEVRWEREPASGELRVVNVAPPPGRVTAPWTFEPATGQWYLHNFLSEQPDLNWREPGVVAAMHDVLRFWLDRGVDGFRADVIHLIGKDEGLADDPPELAALPKSVTNDHPYTHELLRGIRKVLDSYPDERMMVGEVYLLDTAKVATYYGEGDELHLAFNFPPLYTRWRADQWRLRLGEVGEHFGPSRGWPAWVLSNHDNPRHRSRYGTEARARAAAVLLLTVRGTPFLYAGEELGLEDADVPPERRVDPGGRDGCRAPIPWDRSRPHGWGGDPWLPWPPEPDERSVEALREDPGSILHLYRRVLAARRASPALAGGELDLLESPDGVLCWARTAGDDRRVVAMNFTGETRPVDVALDDDDVGWQVVVASDGTGEGDAFPGRLRPDQAVILRPA